MYSEKIARIARLTCPRRSDCAEVERRVRSGEEYRMDGINRANIKSGLQVLIVLKKDQRSGKLTEGKVKDILTKSPAHPHGIKVRLESGEIGRVKKIIEDKG